MDNKYWKIKFFGSMNRKDQVKIIKTVIAAPKSSDIEDLLRHGYVKLYTGAEISVLWEIGDNIHLKVQG